MEKLRTYVKERAQPEHLIAEGYIASEAQRFCSMCIDSNQDQQNSDVGREKQTGSFLSFHGVLDLLDNKNP